MKGWHRGAGIAGLLVIGVLIGLSCSGGGQPGGGSVYAPCQGLEKLGRFRYTFEYKIESPKPEGPVDETQLGEPPFAIAPTADTFSFGQTLDGSFVASDRFSVEVTTPGQEGALPLELIFIADQVWARPGGTDWVSASVPNSFPPQEVCDTVVGELDLKGLASVPDDLNGLKTQRFQMAQAELDVAARLFGGPESDMARLIKLYAVDVWVAEQGWPARLETKGEGTYPSGRRIFLEASLEITDVNAGDIKIEPPVEPPG